MQRKIFYKERVDLLANHKKGNNYIVDKENNIAKIELQRRNKENLWVTIDLEDLDRVINFPYTWFALKCNEATDDWYAGCSEYRPELKQSRPYYLHQFITGIRDKRIDHINTNIRDNRKENLRVISVSDNGKNRAKRNRNNKSGYRNVSWNESSHKWVVQLQINKKGTILGTFPKDQLEEAGRFAEQMRKKYYGEYAGKSDFE